jgi:hypothetical protein
VSYEAHREEYKGYVIRIVHDESPSNPHKEFDHLATLLVWSRDYVSPDPRDFPDIEAFDEWLQDHPAFVRTIFIDGHGGYTTGAYHYPSDSGHDGVAYILADEALREWPVAYCAERAYNCIAGEVKEHSDWATGNVWGYEIGDPETDVGPIDSCWGFIGDHDYALEEARDAVDGMVARADKEAAA